MSEAYLATDPGFDDRLTLPVLWDFETRQIVSNGSGDILRMLNSSFGDLAENSVDLYPVEHGAEIDALNALIYENVNNGVYKAGFSRSQEVYEVYEEACANVFTVLDELEQRLSTSRYLVGDTPTRPTGACSQPSSASTRSTTATSGATCDGSSTTRISGRTHAISTSSLVSPRRSIWPTSRGIARRRVSVCVKLSCQG